jgi:hypothetical protein
MTATALARRTFAGSHRLQVVWQILSLPEIPYLYGPLRKHS